MEQRVTVASTTVILAAHDLCVEIPENVCHRLLRDLGSPHVALVGRFESSNLFIDRIVSECVADACHLSHLTLAVRE